MNTEDQATLKEIFKQVFRLDTAPKWVSKKGLLNEINRRINAENDKQAESSDLGTDLTGRDTSREAPEFKRIEKDFERVVSRLVDSDGTMFGKTIHLLSADEVVHLYERRIQESPEHEESLRESINRVMTGRYAGLFFNDGESMYVFVNPYIEDIHTYRTAMSHEIGHAIEASMATDSEAMAAIHEEFERYLESIGSTNKLRQRDVFATRKLLADAMIHRGYDITSDEIIDSETFEYLTSFKEWFADRAADRLLDPKPPRGLFEKILDKFVDVLRRLFGLANPPEHTVEKFVDSLLKGSQPSWPLAVPDWQFALSRKHELKITHGALITKINQFMRRTTGRTITGTQAEILQHLAITQSVDAMSAAYNQSLKDSLEILFSKEERKALGNMAMSPKIQRQLMFLLREHPQAMNLASTSWDDAVGYMFQFWISGQIDLGNKGYRAGNRLKNTMREIFGYVAEHENVDLLLREFTSGAAYARKQNPNEESFVMKSATRHTRLQRVMRDFVDPAWDKISGNKLTQGLFKAANQRLLDTGNPALRILGNMILRPVGEYGPGEDMLTARTQNIARWTNKIRDAFEGHEDDKELGNRVLELLQHEQDIDPNTKNLDERIALNIRGVLNDIYNYADHAGLDIGYIENYFPWVFDIDYLTSHRNEFIQLMSSPAVARELESRHKLTPDRLHDWLIQDGGLLDTDFNPEEVGHTPKFSNLNQRSLAWINDVMTQEERQQFSQFFQKNLGLTLLTYIEQAVKRSEFHRRFGNKQLEALLNDAIQSGASEKDIALATNYVDATMGTHGHETNKWLRGFLNMEPPEPGEIIHPKLQRAFGIAMVYQNMRTLALATITSLADPMGLAVRTGEFGLAFKAMGAGIKQAYRHARGEESVLVDMAESLGVIDRHMTAEALNWEYGGVYITGPERRVNEMFFRYNLLQSWTRTTRIMSLEAAQRFIRRHIQNPNSESERYLAELGILPEDVQFDENNNLVFMDAQDRQDAHDRINELRRKISTVGKSKYSEEEINQAKKDIAYIKKEVNKSKAKSEGEGGGEITLLMDNLAKLRHKVLSTRPDEEVLQEIETLKRKAKRLQEAAKMYSERGIEGSNAANAAEAISQEVYMLQRMLDARLSPEEIAAKKKAYESEARQLQAELDRDVRVSNAVHRFVDTAILRPNAALRPIWASDPHFMLFFHLKSFMYAFHERILKRVILEAAHGNVAPMVMLGMFIPVMMAGNMLRDLIQNLGETPEYKRDWDAGDYMWDATVRSGILGLGMYAVDSANDIKYGGWGYENFLGPTYEQIEEVFRDGDYNELKALPAQTVYRYWIEQDYTAEESF